VGGLLVVAVVVEIIDCLPVLLELVVLDPQAVDPMLVVVMERTHLQKEPEILELMLLEVAVVVLVFLVVMAVLVVPES
jgi:hypothetical protein